MESFTKELVKSLILSPTKYLFLMLPLTISRLLYSRYFVTYQFFLGQVCIWDFYGRKRHALMTDIDKTLDDANIQMDQDVGDIIFHYLFCLCPL